MEKFQKTLSLSDVQLKADGGSFEGYASVFGGVDTYGDTIIKGAFASTLRANGKPKMFFNHEWRLPIGKFTAVKEDDHGLFVKGELTPGLSLSEDVGAALRHGTLDGLSIGGFIKAEDYEATETGRVIRKWSVLTEISPVAFPADRSARIDLSTVKSELDAIESVRDFERFLRDAGDFSNGLVDALMARARVVFGGERQATEAKADAEATALAAITARLQSIHQGIKNV